MGFTLSELQTTIQDYVDNTEVSFVNNIHNFIKSSEERILKNIDLEYFKKNVTSTLTNADPYLTCPDDLLAVFSLQITTSGSQTFLLIKDVNFLQEAYSTSASTATPRFYARFDINNFILAPTPNSAYTVEMHYFYRPESLADTTVTMSITSVTGTFTTNDTISGSISGVETAVSTGGTTSIVVRIPSSNFTVGETITGSSSGATGTFQSITTTDATTTWLSENAPYALLYGALVEAYSYMKGEQDLLTLYNSRFQDQMSSLKDLAEARENSDAYEDGLPRRART